MVNHIVTFRLKGTPEQRLDIARRFRDALLALPSQIDVLKSMQVGINENPAEDWDIVLHARVERMADVATYSVHPAHVAAASIIAPYRDARACVDYSD
ncbi:MAG TPA: stress responsive protein [Porphyromonadaceae bacterium]|nr:stress responsive protein [Porphyromonadaceae bacterium]